MIIKFTKTFYLQLYTLNLLHKYITLETHQLRALLKCEKSFLTRHIINPLISHNILIRHENFLTLKTTKISLLDIIITSAVPATYKKIKYLLDFKEIKTLDDMILYLQLQLLNVVPVFESELAAFIQQLSKTANIHITLRPTLPLSELSEQYQAFVTKRVLSSYTLNRKLKRVSKILPLHNYKSLYITLSTCVFTLRKLLRKRNNPDPKLKEKIDNALLSLNQTVIKMIEDRKLYYKLIQQLKKKHSKTLDVFLNSVKRLLRQKFRLFIKNYKKFSNNKFTDIAQQLAIQENLPILTEKEMIRIFGSLISPIVLRKIKRNKKVYAFILSVFPDILEGITKSERYNKILQKILQENKDSINKALQEYGKTTELTLLKLLND